MEQGEESEEGASMSFRGLAGGRAFLPELGESGPAAGPQRSGPEPLQGGQQAEQEPETQHCGAGLQPPAGRAEVA